MKKGKLNPDRYKVTGGDPVETGKKVRPRSASTEQNRKSNKLRTSPSDKRAKDSFSLGGSEHTQSSRKTGKRSGAQKSADSRLRNEAWSRAKGTPGAFGKP